MIKKGLALGVLMLLSPALAYASPGLTVTSGSINIELPVTLVDPNSCDGNTDPCWVGYLFGPGDLFDPSQTGGAHYNGDELSQFGTNNIDIDWGSAYGPGTQPEGVYHVYIFNDNLGVGSYSTCYQMSGAGSATAEADCLQLFSDNSISPSYTYASTYPADSPADDALGVNGTLSTGFSGLGTVMGVVFGAILVGFIALLGLGFGFRKLKKYVLGRPF